MENPQAVLSRADQVCQPFLIRTVREWSYGISDIEGKAAMGSGVWPWEASEFQIRGPLGSKKTPKNKY
jgi:hypothetical protein